MGLELPTNFSNYGVFLIGLQKKKISFSSLSEGQILIEIFQLKKKKLSLWLSKGAKRSLFTCRQARKKVVRRLEKLRKLLCRGVPLWV